METFPSHAELLAALVEQILESMDGRTLEQFAREKLTDAFSGCSYEELLVDAEDYGLPVQGLIPPESDD